MVIMITLTLTTTIIIVLYDHDDGRVTQAPSNGWETWFSLQYGTDLSKLRAPVKKIKATKADKQREAMKKEAAAAAKAVEKPPGPKEPASKFFPKKLAYANYTKERLRLLNKLLDYE